MEGGVCTGPRPSVSLLIGGSRDQSRGGLTSQPSLWQPSGSVDIMPQGRTGSPSVGPPGGVRLGPGSGTSLCLSPPLCHLPSLTGRWRRALGTPHLGLSPHELLSSHPSVVLTLPNMWDWRPLCCVCLVSGEVGPQWSINTSQGLQSPGPPLFHQPHFIKHTVGSPCLASVSPH